MESKNLASQEKRMRAYRKHLLFRLAMWKRLPSVAFWGLKVLHLDRERCKVAVPYRWRTQNPFNSIYFSVLAGAAELSTGIMMDCLLSGEGKSAMLVTNFNMDFVKKAKTLTTFTCIQGQEIIAAIENARQNPEGQIVMLSTVGTNADGEVVAKATITWSIKIRR